jgi:hypothetical protein
MPSRAGRREARKRVEEVFGNAIGKVIPSDESAPLRGNTFADFEDQVEEAGNAVMVAMLEERSKLDASAWRENPGRCPHCGSDRVYLEEEAVAKKVLSRWGPVTVRLQQCRCRACDGSFSPTGA